MEPSASACTALVTSTLFRAPWAMLTDAYCAPTAGVPDAPVAVVPQILIATATPEPAPESRFRDSDADSTVLPANADVSNHMQPRFSPSVPYLPCHSQ